jgi:hypothetical protein
MFVYVGELTNQIIANKLDQDNEDEAKVLNYLKLCTMTGTYDTKSNNQFIAKNYFVKSYYG